MRNKSTNRPGQIIVILALLLVVVIAFVAIALDGGLLLDHRRKAQAAADAAALAGACDIYYHQINDKHGDFTWVKKHAWDVAQLNGYLKDDPSNRTVVLVEWPPKSGLHIDDYKFVEVIIQYNQPRGFSTIFGTGDIPVRARAVAGIKMPPSPAAVIVLDLNSKGALTASGNGTGKVNGGVIVNSGNSAGAIGSGNGGVQATGGFFFSGDPGYNGNFQGTISSHQQATPDPLAGIPQPQWYGDGDSRNSPPSYWTVRSKSQYKYSGSTPITLEPGVYIGGISLTCKGDVTLNPGVYYMKGGGFSMTGQGSINGDNVMIYNDPQKSSDAINIASQGAVNLNYKVPPPMEAYPTFSPYMAWDNMTIWQRRDATTDVSITGDGKYNIGGTFYVAGGNLKVAGQAGDVFGSQFVSYNLTLVGNGNFEVGAGSTIRRPTYLGLVE